MAEDGGVGKRDLHMPPSFVNGVGETGLHVINVWLTLCQNVLDVMILTRMLFSCLVDADFLDTAVIAVCFDCTVAPHAGSVD